MGADDCGHDRGVSWECRLVEARRRSCVGFEEWNSDSQTGSALWVGLEAGEAYGMTRRRALQRHTRKEDRPYLFN